MNYNSPLLLFYRLYHIFVLSFTIITILLYCSYDFSYRIYPNDETIKIKNRIISYIEFVCNCFFLFEVIIEFLSNSLMKNAKPYLFNYYNILNLIIVVSSFLIYVDHHIISEIFKFIRITRVLKLIYIIPSTLFFLSLANLKL